MNDPTWPEPLIGGPGQTRVVQFTGVSVSADQTAGVAPFDTQKSLRAFCTFGMKMK